MAVCFPPRQLDALVSFASNIIPFDANRMGHVNIFFGMFNLITFKFHSEMPLVRPP